MAQLCHVDEVVGVTDGADAGFADANNCCDRSAGGTGAGAAVDVVDAAAGDANAASAGADDAADSTAYANDTIPPSESSHDATASAWIQTPAEDDSAEGTVQTS